VRGLRGAIARLKAEQPESLILSAVSGYFNSGQRCVSAEAALSRGADRALHQVRSSAAT